jgi:hypothetical protein
MADAAAAGAQGGADGPGGADALPSVCGAFALGWQMSELYRLAAPPAPAAGAAAAHASALPHTLPGNTDLTAAQVTELTIASVAKAIERLPGGVDQPSTDGLGQGAKGTLRRRVYALHLELLSALGAADFRLAKAYGLGRAMADCAYPHASLEELRRDFAHDQAAPLEEWLTDLATAFPAHATRSVAHTFADWKRWLAATPPTVQTATGQPPRPLDWATDERAVQERVARQAKLWRTLLSGEKRPEDMLEPEGYMACAQLAFSRSHALMLAFLRRVWVPFVVAIVTILVLLVVAIVASSVAGVIAAVAAAAAALGLTWKSAATSVGSVAVNLEKPIWSAELDSAIGQAISCVPDRPSPPDKVLASGPRAAVAFLAATTPQPAPAATGDEPPPATSP